MEPKYLTAEEQESMSAAFRAAKPKERLEAAREYVACLERTATSLREAVKSIESKLSESNAENTKLAGDLSYARRRLVEVENAMTQKDARIAELEGEAERQRQRAEDALLGSSPTQPNIDIGRSQHNKTPVPAGKWNAPRGTY